MSLTSVMLALDALLNKYSSVNVAKSENERKCFVEVSGQCPV